LAAIQHRHNLATNAESKNFSYQHVMAIKSQVARQRIYLAALAAKLLFSQTLDATDFRYYLFVRVMPISVFGWSGGSGGGGVGGSVSFDGIDDGCRFWRFRVDVRGRRLLFVLLVARRRCYGGGGLIVTIAGNFGRFRFCLDCALSSEAKKVLFTFCLPVLMDELVCACCSDDSSCDCGCC
jgi:hypothetical protein